MWWQSKPGRLVCCRHWRVAVATPTPGLAASDTLRCSIDCGDSGCDKPSGSGRSVYGCPSGKPQEPSCDVSDGGEKQSETGIEIVGGEAG